ncbi:MAG: J domain-containing protein [Phycisphaerae bacterium]|nr:J domain-containing protein [Phycisphaerae bacterium]
MGQYGARHPDPVECLRLLGLPEAASAAQIKRAYHLLAQRYHPDKSGGDEASRRHFVAISRAYRFLMKTARLVEDGKPVGRCRMCGEFGEAVIGLDGGTRCPACLLRPGGRLLLPVPTFVVVKCVSVFTLLGVGAYLLLRALQTGNAWYAAGGALAALAALGVLTLICLRVVYCIQPHEEAARRARLRHRRA